MPRLHLARRVAFSLPLLVIPAFLGTAGARASTQPPVVVSDQIHFKAFAVAPGPGPYQFRSTSCALTSDGEPVVFACQESGQFSLTSTSGGSGSAKVTSKDGTIIWKFVFTRVAKNTYQMAGKGYELDNEGPPQPIPYPCGVAGTITVTPGAALTLTGSETVYESANEP